MEKAGIEPARDYYFPPDKEVRIEPPFARFGPNGIRVEIRGPVGGYSHEPDNFLPHSKQWRRWDSNPQPSVCKTDALPIRATPPILTVFLWEKKTAKLPDRVIYDHRTSAYKSDPISRRPAPDMAASVGCSAQNGLRWYHILLGRLHRTAEKPQVVVYQPRVYVLSRPVVWMEGFEPP